MQAKIRRIFNILHRIFDLWDYIKPHQEEKMFRLLYSWRTSHNENIHCRPVIDQSITKPSSELKKLLKTTNMLITFWHDHTISTFVYHHVHVETRTVPFVLKDCPHVYTHKIFMYYSTKAHKKCFNHISTQKKKVCHF